MATVIRPISCDTSLSAGVFCVVCFRGGFRASFPVLRSGYVHRSDQDTMGMPARVHEMCTISDNVMCLSRIT